MRKAVQMSESFEVAIFLALSGGLMDAYSYLGRGEVFSNAQTGNMLLFGVHAAEGDLEKSLYYLFPILAFALGIALAQIMKMNLYKYRRIHWRQLALLVEVILLAYVSMLSASSNSLANSIISFACGIQVQAFRKLHSKGFSTTMCIGNLRSGTHETMEFIHTRRREHLESGLMYFFVIFCFVLGAIIGAKSLQVIGLKAIVISPILLLCALILMFIDREKKRYSRSS
ncbi:YoaK family protein [Peptostreptococcus equinus]|uniref:YoaK family protein n=1 Tax=Peptostreptococcus equinus TaxID=3003601 RepID=A0ABY7JRB7_9FIRM|nr:YoaK family protein [Peptostreptococcus sp. CBA3647]WAW15029.1 YoaK family protein [Peptostreptococcus sp. CBA3647]